jgi:opacity protein-like surface antigen
MRKLLLTATALIALAAPASADLVVGANTFVGNGTLLTLTPTVPGGNQPLNNPCIICGANQPQQPTGFGYNNFGNTGQPGQTYSMFSTATIGGSLNNDQLGTGYDGSFLRDFLIARGDTALNFNIGFDVNDTGTAQTLESFWFLNLTQRTVLAVYSPGPGGTLVPSQNNGTGYPDYTLTGLSLDRGDILPNDQIIFFARITGANDGPDSFFLVPEVTAAVPELSTWFMMIIGFAGVGTLAMRRRRQIGEHAFRVV